MSRRTHSRFDSAVAAAVTLAAALLMAAPAGAADDLILKPDGKLTPPPGHPAMTVPPPGHPAMTVPPPGHPTLAALPPDHAAPAAVPGATPDSAPPVDAAAAPADGLPEPGAAGDQPMYTARNMRDPFSLPAEVRAPEAKREDVPPLERAPLSDFHLVAVVKKHGAIVAMVTSTDGKGYMVGVGTRIGSDGGEIRRIMPDSVIVEQVRADEFGELKKSETVLGLRPEEVVP
jgi:Tfp pilus assembly protein PilP